MHLSSVVSGLPSFIEVQDRITAFNPNLPFRLVCDGGSIATSILLTCSWLWPEHITQGVLRDLGFPADMVVLHEQPSLVAGGMRAGASDSDTSSEPSSDLINAFRRERNLPTTLVLAVSSPTCADPLFDCLSGFLRAMIPSISIEQLCQHVRTLVSLWLGQAAKQGYIVAGLMVTDIAEMFGIDFHECPSFISAAKTPSDGAVYFVYVVGCLLQTSMCVLDSDNQPADGYIRPLG
eukprot:5967916-Amphidinium_carterae.1